MDEILYIDEELAKAKEQTGERQGGKAVARVQTGYEKDGSPAYRYFDTPREYREYLLQQSKKKREGKKDSKKGKTNKKKKGKATGVNIKDKLQSKLQEEQQSTRSKLNKAWEEDPLEGFYIGEDYE